MRIAQVAPLYESVPPRLYGGTERVVSWLTEELVSLGHEVTLFASGDSVTNARLISWKHKALRLDPDCIDPLAHHILMIEQVYERAEEFDLIHFHIDYLHFPLSRREQVPCVTTLHGRLDLPDLAPLYREFTDMPVSRFPMRSASLCPGSTGLGRSTMDFRRTSLPMQEHEETTWHFLAGSRRRREWIEQSGSQFVRE